MKNIRIGTMIGAGTSPEIIHTLIDLGFESFAVGFGRDIAGQNLKEWADRFWDAIGDSDIEVSVVSVYDNPLGYDDVGEISRKAWETLIDGAQYFKTNIVAGFTGRLPGIPIHDNMKRFGEVFGELGKRANAIGVKLAFENCSMGGNWWTGEWNIAHNPTAWEMMFNSVSTDNLGLQWEPCHQMVQLIDPIPQLRKWAPKVLNVHGKDATIDWTSIKEYGFFAPRELTWHRTPGFGDTNWADVISILRMNKYQGNIDIEGYHDPVYREELELTGQVHALEYLKFCRGGKVLPNIFK